MKRIHFEEIDSTAVYVLNNIDKINEDTIISTNYQTMGIGSKQRKYNSYKGCGLYFNLVLVNTKQTNMIYVVCCAIVEVLKEYNKEIEIKWINDLMYQNKKVGGILVHQKDNKVSIGIGLNLYKPKEGYNELNYKITNLFDREIDKEILLEKIINKIDYYKEKNCLNLYQEYARLDKLNIEVDGNSVAFVGLKEDGRILVKEGNKVYLVDDIRYEVKIGAYYEN